MRVYKEHIKNKETIKRCAELAQLSRNLYNRINYILRQVKEHPENIPEYADLIKNGFISQFDLAKRMRAVKDPDFKAVPNSNVGDSILKDVYQNWKSFFQSLKKREKGRRYSVPGYALDKYGREKGQTSFYSWQVGRDISIKDGMCNFPKAAGLPPIKNIVSGTLKQIRLVWKNGQYYFYHVYEEKKSEVPDLDYNKYLGIDVGVDNLFTCITTDSDAFIVNGKVLKSINQFWNKKSAEARSFVGNRGWSKRLDTLNHKRNNRIETLGHKYSKYVVQYCVEHNIGNIIIGKNKGWKQESDMGKKGNQRFVCIPHAKIIDMIKYKADAFGIKVEEIEEAYTSKCDALGKESIEKHEEYTGKRKHRGLFISGTGVELNADVNGALNILRKKIGDSFLGGMDVHKLQEVRRIDM
jgi:putative transposase